MIRVGVLVAVGLLCAGGGLSGNVETAGVSKALSEAGYIVFVVALVALIVMIAHLWRDTSIMNGRDMIVSR